MNESIESIVTEMRERADAMQTHGTTHGVRLAVLEFARRIEAAWKRQEQCYLDQIRDAVNMIGHERFVKEHPQSGNAGAMREALERLRTEIERFYNNEWIPYDAWQGCDDVISHALAAPARNCDLDLSEKSLWDKFQDYMNDCGLPFYSEPSGEDAFDWLFAPAEEQKGECNGK